MNDDEFRVKGEALLSIPIFILKKFGQEKYKRWLESLTPEARAVYSNPIAKSDWYPVESMIVEPTRILCDRYYNGSLRGAWDCGRYSAEFGLKGIYRVLVKLRSPMVLIRKAEAILPAYYRPCGIDVIENKDGRVTVHVKKLPKADDIIVHRIAGWIERAIEISGCKHVTVKINRKVVDYNPVIEYTVSWKQYGK